MTPKLEVKGIAAGYNGRAVIHQCSFTVEPKQVVALVGSNGAGKTTLVSAVSGRLPLLGGDIHWNGRSIAKTPAYQRSRLGMVHVPQGREMFGRLTVLENLRIAASPDASDKDWAFVYDLFPKLKLRLQQEAGTLSGGEQQMVAISRAILTKASLVILDEPSLGLAPKVVTEMFEGIREFSTRLQVSIILVEQQAKWIWDAGIVNFVYVLAGGTIVSSGPPNSFDRNKLQELYLGKATGRRVESN